MDLIAVFIALIVFSVIPSYQDGQEQLLVIVFDELSYHDVHIFPYYGFLGKLRLTDQLMKTKDEIEFDDLVINRVKQPITESYIEKLVPRLIQRMKAGDSLVIGRVAMRNIRESNRQLRYMYNELSKSLNLDMVTIMIVGSKAPGLVLLNTRNRNHRIIKQKTGRASYVKYIIGKIMDPKYVQPPKQHFILLLDNLSYNDKLKKYFNLAMFLEKNTRALYNDFAKPQLITKALELSPTPPKRGEIAISKAADFILAGNKITFAHVNDKTMDEVDYQLEQLIKNVKEVGKYPHLDMLIVGNKRPGVVALRSDVEANFDLLYDGMNNTSMDKLLKRIISTGKAKRKSNQVVIFLYPFIGTDNFLYYPQSQMIVKFQNSGVFGATKNVSGFDSILKQENGKPLFAWRNTACHGYAGCCRYVGNECTGRKNLEAEKITKMAFSSLLKGFSLVLASAHATHIIPINSELENLYQDFRDFHLDAGVNVFVITEGSPGIFMAHGPDIKKGVMLKTPLTNIDIRNTIRKALRMAGPYGRGSEIVN